MKNFEIAIFIAVILAVVLYRVNKAYRYRKWLEQRAKETAEIWRVYEEYNAYDGFENIQCECGYSKELRGIWLMQTDEYWEGKICPCCGRRWVFKRRSESDGNL
jgi:hypothetical protein